MTDKWWGQNEIISQCRNICLLSEVSKLESGLCAIVSWAAKQEQSNQRPFDKWVEMQSPHCTVSFLPSSAGLGQLLQNIMVQECGYIYGIDIACGIKLCMVWCGRWCGLVKWLPEQVRRGMLMQSCIVTFRYILAFPNSPTSFGGMSTSSQSKLHCNERIEIEQE